METEETIKVRKDEAGVNETVVCGAVHTREEEATEECVETGNQIQLQVCRHHHSSIQKEGHFK